MGKKIVIWPAYLDAEKSRREGRKVSKKDAVRSPASKNILHAAKVLGLNPQLDKDKGHPREHQGKRGRVLVDKKGSKGSTLRAIAKEMRKKR